ncbi:Protein of unknown function [Bacillus cytotoxicus]|nr:Protein of unknown function [Bacillus cytotoxicus]
MIVMVNMMKLTVGKVEMKHSYHCATCTER